MAVTITFPVGRLVQGSVWRAKTTDYEGKPMVWKSGPDAGKPRSGYFFAVALPKAGESHWSQTPWGQQIVAEARGALPNATSLPQFSWKVEDGDSVAPNRRGKAPAAMEGFPGHWVLRFNGSFAPEVGTWRGTAWTALTDPQGAPQRGDYVQVQAIAEFNKNPSNPGMYLNYKGVCFNRSGEPIRGGEFDAAAAGFAASEDAAPAPAASPSGFGAPPPAAASPSGFSAPPPPPPVAPHHDFVAAAAGPKMTAKAVAAGITYAALKAQGWTDALMATHGWIEDDVPF